MIASGSEYEFKAFPYSSHYWILKLLERERTPVRILDAGTASGYLGKILKGRGHVLAGIEYDAATAEKAKQYYDSFQVADVEAFAFPYRREFDYILFADVLEHLRDPAAVLRKCIPALKESGKIIISVPNVANFLIRLSLLFGRFDYMDRGILDRTHLRFFTLRSLKEMMNDVSCDVLDVIPTSLPVQIVFPFTENKFFTPLHKFVYALTESWETSFAYQFVIVAAPRQLPLPRADEDRDVVPGESGQIVTPGVVARAERISPQDNTQGLPKSWQRLSELWLFATIAIFFVVRVLGSHTAQHFLNRIMHHSLQ